jgi:hypothetical protein
MVVGDNFSNTTYRDVILIRTDADGDLVWNKTYDFGGVESGTAVCKSQDYGYTFSVSSWPGALAQIDMDGELIWYLTYSQGLNDIEVTQDGGLISTGFYSDIQGGKLYLVKTTQSGIITAVDIKADENYVIKCSPNPFISNANIAYEVQTPSRTKISVFDVRGNSVCILVDGYQQPGKYNVSFEAFGVPNGLYLFLFETGNNRFTIKAIKQ